MRRWGRRVEPTTAKSSLAGTEVKVAVLAVEEGGRRIRLSRTKVRAHEEQAETQAYLASSQQRQGFGLSLGDLLQQSKRKK